MHINFKQRSINTCSALASTEKCIGITITTAYIFNIQYKIVLYNNERCEDEEQTIMSVIVL